MRHFALNAWGPATGSFVLVRADADWISVPNYAGDEPKHFGWFSITIGLLGFCACLTYWPGGKS